MEMIKKRKDIWFREQIKIYLINLKIFKDKNKKKKLRLNSS